MATSTNVLWILISLCVMQSLKLGSSVSCIKSERIALVKFKNTITDESGRLASWAGNDCCTWKGVSCNNKTGHVERLNLHNPAPFDYDRFNYESGYAANYSRSCLGGEISKSLLDLEHLFYLDLSMNNFSGAEIPKFLGSMKRLRYLDLSIARFGGNIPRHIGNLSGLQYLDLGDFWTNRLTADSLGWVSNLSSLEHLDLSGVQLGEAEDWLVAVNVLPSLSLLNLSNCNVGRIPPLPQPNFTSLVSLDLRNNIVNSGLPLWIFNVTSLVNLRLDGNGFSGRIPDMLGRLTELRALGLSSNFFNTSMPDSVFNLTNLNYLDLSQNKFQGKIPTAINRLCKLQFFDLSGNRFTGEMPEMETTSFRCFRDLEVLRVSYNSMEGPIPTSFGTLSSLRELDISNNLFNGSIPSSLGQLLKLEKLDVSNNSLTGVVSQLHFAELTRLTELSMSLNSLVFNMSSQWIPPFQLKTIKLASCILGPRFPPWLETQRLVEELRISNTSIIDDLPDWFGKHYSRVHRLDLSNNQISGKLPKFEEGSILPYRRLILNSNKFYGPLTPIPTDVLLWDVSDNLLAGGIPLQSGINLTLEVLILSNNQLYGEIPKFLCEVKGIMVIDLSSNKLSGTLPRCLGDLQGLSMLDLTSNNLHGKIPSSFGALTGLFSLHLRDNRFSGKLPPLQNITYLRILDVGKNALSDQIPPWIGENLSNLQYLSLFSNKFYGRIPPHLCQLPELQLLDLAGNNLKGGVPPCLGNLTGMIVKHSAIEYLIMDVDYGADVYAIVQGMERRYTKTLPFLTSIDMSENNLTGRIPEELMGLQGLRNLNLSGNYLNGAIPGKIGRLTELVSLDLSRNQLSGPIPPTLSSLTFLSHLNLSFNSLSGRIPTGNQLQTLNDKSIYMGNDGLCGTPLPKPCSGDRPGNDPNAQNQESENDDTDDSFFPWFCIGLGPGFSIGLVGFCSVLFKDSWRIAYFCYIERACKAILGITSAQAHRQRRRFH